MKGFDINKDSIEKSESFRRIEKEYINSLKELSAQKELAEKSEKRYRDLLNNLSAGIVVHGPNTEIIFNNSLASELLGLTECQLKGREALDPRWHFFREDGEILQTEEYPINIIINSKKPLRNYFMGINHPESNKRVWVMLDGFPVLDEKGNIKEVLISFIDFTEQKKMEAKIMDHNEKTTLLDEIKRKESQLSAILNNTNVIINSFDRGYRLIEFNDAYIKLVKDVQGKTPKHGESVFDYIPKESHEERKNTFDKIFKGENVNPERSTYQYGKKEIVLQRNYHPIYHGDVVIAISVFLEDISERRAYEIMLEKAVKEKEFLLNEIHHRVKNNLAIVSSLLQLEELNTDNLQIKETLISSQNRIKSTALIHQFLYQNDSIESVVFNDYIKEFINQARMIFESHQAIDIDVQGKDFYLGIELATPCGLIINELLTNSIKHAFKESQSSPKIWIQLVQDEKYITIRYKDNGVGFVVNCEKSKSLGITIIKTLSKQIKGECKYISDNGTVFELIFPYTRE